MSSPLDLIRLSLVELADDMNGDNPDNVDSQAVATNICNMALSDLKEDEMDMATSLLFNPEKGILYFLKKALDRMIHTGAKTTFLEFTAEFISRYPTSVASYIIDIKARRKYSLTRANKTCLTLFLNDSSARVKKSAMLPIKFILTSCNRMIDPEALDINGLFEKLFTAYGTQQSKMASTVKGEVLEVLGVVSRHFPKVAEERCAVVLRWYLSAIQDQLRPGGKQELSLVAGAVSGLDNFLYSFEHKANKDVPTILQIIKTLVNVPEDLARFATPVDRERTDNINYYRERVQLFSAEGTDRSSTHLAAFITAYTFVAKVYDEIPELLMTALNQMADAAVVNFTKMSTYARIDCTLAIERLLIMLYHKGEGVLRGFIEKLSYKLLVFTSADIAKPKPTAYRGSEQSTDDTAWHSYTIYLFLWRNLFKPTSLSKELNKAHEEISTEDQEKFLRIIYGSTMESFKRLVTLLNLSVSDSEMDLDDGPSLNALEVQLASDSTNGPASGDIAKMQANCAKDFIIFQNLTEFWQIFLPEIRPYLFARWAFVIGDTLIDLSARHPLVSGFYKMFATCLQVCQSISLFAEAGKADSYIKAEDELVDHQRTAALFSKYIREVLARLEQYKDDLLASCLHLVLSSPSALTNSTSIIAPIQLALKLGLGYFPLASIGLDAIERWIDIVSGDQDTWFGQVLPPLNDYLMVQITSVDEKDDADTYAVKSRRRTPSRSQTYKAVAKRAFLLTSAEQVQSLRDLQLRILKLLGRQAGHNKLILEGQLSQQDGAKKVSSDLLAWDPEPRVKLKIPFQEMKTELQLDEMLPRIVDLAENSLNRQIKIASCELLHSLVILMIGSSAFRARDAQDPKKSPFHKIYLKVFPALLRLAVDVDQVSRSLYRPLVSQLIHWLTNGAQYENPETIALLSCCMDAACDTLGPLRDFGAECLGEFVKWSIKQTATSASSSVNVKSLLKRVYNLASHSNPAKRLGAALIVNRIYRVFREETPLVNQFTMELLYWMLFSLKLAEVDHAGLGTRQQSRMAITHLQRIISVKVALFVKDSKDRRRIPGLETATLDSLVQWLLGETARTEVEYTQVCRTLFDSFVTLLPQNYTPGAWIGSKLSLDPTFLLSTYPVVQHNSETFSQPTMYRKWCSQLASTTTNCSWLLNHQGSSDLVVAQLKKTMVFAVAAKFLEKCLLFSRALARNQMTTPLTASERMQIMDQNFFTARKVFSFVSRLISRSADRDDGSLVYELKSSGLLGPQLFSVFAVCLFDPDAIGSDELLKSEEEKMALSREFEASLKAFIKLPAGQDPIKSKAVLDGIQLVQRCNLLEMMFNGSSKEANHYVESLYDTFMRMQETQDPLWIDYCSSLLRLCLAERQSRHGLWEYLLDPKNANAAKVTYLKYSGELNRQLAIHFLDLSPLLSQSAKSSPLLLDIWANFLDHLFSHPELAKEREGFLDMLTKDFSALESIVESLGKDQVTTVIALWKRLVALSPRILRMSKSSAFVSFFFKVYQGFFERDTEKKEYLTLPIMFKDYIAALDLLLKALVLSSNINLFKTLMGVAIRESNHPHMEEIQRSISSFALKLPLSKFLEVASYCFDEFLKRTHSDEHRRNIVHQILLPTLKTVPPLSVTEFYVLHIVKIMGVVKQDPPRSTDVDFRRDYIERGCCYGLIHVLYMRLPSELVNTKDSKIVDAFAKGKAATGKELTVEVFRTANAAKFKQDAAHYHFEQVLSGPLVKSRLSDLRSKSLNPNKTYNSKYQYLSSQYLRDSSLSQSVGVLDDNVYVDQESDPRDESVGSSEADSMADLMDPSKAAAEVKNDDRPLEPEQTLELDSINSNPCMKMILLIIKELHSSITRPPKEMAKEESTMPSWMKDIHRKLTNSNTAINIRLFLAKMILNMPEAFEMYAHSWIRPLMRLAIEGESYGEAMNYFVRTYLMKHCHHEQRQYLKDNIDLIKGVFENWSNIAIVPTTVIYNNFKSVKDDKKNVTGVQLLGIVLTHDNPPFYKGPEIDLGTLNEEEYYQALVRNMGSPHKSVYTSTAEVCGLVLAYMKRHNVAIEEFQELVTRKLFELLVPSAGSGPRSKSGNVVVHFLNSLHKVQLNYAEITDTFGPRILFLFPQLLGEERALALEILAGRAAYLPELFQSLQGLNFLGCLRHRDEATQFAALSIIYGLWESLEASHIMYFLDTLVLEFSSHSSIECRKLYYSILMVLFDKHADTPMVSGVLRTQLLCGLGDSSESIRHTIVEFWYDKNRLPADTFLRLQELVGNMYDTQAEDKFLSYATYMLLDRTKKSSDYTEPIFADPLPNAKFSDSYANIDTSWRSTAAMTPLFVPTQQSQSQDMRREGTLGEDELRATQSTFDFSMTLDGGAPGIRSQLGGTANSSSTLLFRSASIQASGLNDSSQKSGANQKYRRLQHRRVATDQADDAQRFKRAWEAKMNTQMQAAVDKENARAKAVSMIRKYRDGDLPDIQILYSDIIRPLQSLAELDVEICRMLFSKLVTGLMAQADSYIEVEDDATTFKDTLVGNLRRMLERSTALFAPFVGCILRICHDYGEADIPAELISKVAIRSSNQHLGIILLEKQIQHLDPKERSVKRQKTGARGQHDPKQHSWNELARVYKSIDEKDVYKSICESKVASKDLDYTARAIEAEVLGDYGRAAEVYFEAIDKYYSQEIEIDEIERGIWAQGRLECLEYLGEWNNLEANMMADLDNDPREIWSEDYQDPYLHFYLTTYLKLVDGKEEDGMLTAWTSENPNPLFRFIERAMNNPAHRQVLTTQYQPELALAALLGKDYKQASHFVRQSYERFLSIWSNLHPLSTRPRLHELAGLQRIVELEEFLGGIDTVLRSSTNDPFQFLLSKWERRYPGKTTDTMVTWHNVLDDRSLMIRRLEDHVPYSRKQEGMVKKHRIHNLLKLSAAAREQGNFLVAENCISSMQGLSASSYDLYASQLKLNLSKATIELDRSRNADLLLDTLASFEERLTNMRGSDPSQVVSLQLLGSKAYGQLRDLLADDRGVLEHVESSAWAQGVLRKNPRANIPQELQHRGYDCLQTAATLETGEKMAKKLRLTTASYCDRILRHYESDEDKGLPSLNVKYLDLYANLVVKNTLLSMQDEETGATELFPRLLQIIETYPSSQKPFTELIAQQYPNALYYPLTISSENFTFENSSSGQKRKADVASLKKAVYSPLKEDFIFELRRLTNPDHLLKDWLEQTVALFQSKTRNAEQVMALYQDLHRLVLDVNNPRLGSIAKAFAAKHGSKLESLCGKSGQRLTTMSNKDFNAHVIKYCKSEILNKDIPKKHGEGDLLKSYSPWLSSFQSSDHEGLIDIPGQYTGLTPPHGQQSVTIVRFDQRVLAMSSIRKPKRISILGSDEKEHLFLVKGGEDLRLDQRIQQLFSLMNDIMHKDPQCSQQNISVATYKVVPMSGSLGILEWVDNTKPLRHCIEGEVSPKDSWKRTQEQHNRFVASFKGDMMGYYNLFMHAPREKVVKHMDSLFSQMRDDCLKQSVARLAASPEAFLMLRSEFAKSLAAINVCSYILGIGDRHLENFLLDMSNGCLIPIDFGHAFGSATEVLPVPELVPFRLTRQLEGFLKPLGIKGLLEHPMVCIMKALQTKKEVILNTMDIFVKEPLLDWRSHALKQAREQHKRGANMESFEIDENSVAPPAWYLQQKIDIARKKLEGYNPSHLTVRELTSGHLNKPYLPALTKITLGDKKHNVRARHGEVCAGVQAQVECLIDMATDPDLLAPATTTASTTAAAAAKSSLPRTYFVERTKAGQLPVYSEFKNAGTRPLTIIRKIQGNATALKTDLLTTYPGAEVRVNERSNQVILKGLVMDDVRQWLTAKGF
ncbi:hypothetical protein BGZ70_005357 [Mortierella alpina]|uniref:DNA-dependent protein kinase catalytic subunit n=1 Tax=Mortierella alpina TaxID=64518 RepID=A0A9P6JCD8_MORAP|nr:hypothetical protein BGZ70_005357 [Mortierella alpina]